MYQLILRVHQPVAGAVNLSERRRVSADNETHKIHAERMQVIIFRRTLVGQFSITVPSVDS